MPRSTSADVARLAGVSRATVSFVLNDRADQSIPEATRQRVRDAARQLSYVPNAASRALRGGASKLVLFVSAGYPMSTNVSDFQNALTALVADSERSLVVWRRQGPDDLAATLAHLEPCLVIAEEALSQAEEALLRAVRIPLLVTDFATPGTTVPTRIQAETLYGLGHRRIGYLTTSEPTLLPFADPRTTAFLSATDELGLPRPLVAALPGGMALSVETVADQLGAWLAGPEPVTAVACFNDFHAAVCLSAAASVGVVVPDRLSVIGLDDDVFAHITHPPLTTVKLDPTGFATHVWAKARAHLDTSPAPEPYDEPARLVERASVRAVDPERTHHV